MNRQNYTVLELTLKFKTDWEYLDRRDLSKISKSISRWCKRAKYGGKIVGMLVVTNETAADLMKRVRAAFEAIPAIDDYWCQTAGSDGIGRHGNLCPFQTAVGLAWEEARKRNYPKKVSDFRTQNIWLNHGVDYFNRKAAIKMGLRPHREGKGKKDPTTDRDK